MEDDSHEGQYPKRIKHRIEPHLLVNSLGSIGGIPTGEEGNKGIWYQLRRGYRTNYLFCHTSL